MSAQLSAEIISKLLGLAKSQGIDLGLAPEGSEALDERPVFPVVNISKSYSEVAHETGLNLKNSGLYLYKGRLVTINELGADEEMDAERFRTWIDQWQLNFTKRRPKKNEDDDGPGAPIKTTMRADMAKVIMRSDDFRGHLPEIKRILPVSLPVFVEREDQPRTTRMLPIGYDKETQIYTSDTGIDYALDWTLERAVSYLRELYKDFPFADEGRSLAVQIAGMLTMYCQLLFPERDRWPMIFFNANQPGSGKSRLAEMMVYFIYGSADTVTYGENDEFVKKLDTWAQKGDAYTFIDDVSGLIKSNELNKWLTFPTWSGRIMHSQRMFSVLNQTLTLLTGNQATLSDDLGRRSLMIDLWLAELPGARQNKIARVIDAKWLCEKENREAMLSAMYALLQHWAAAGMVPYKKLIPSFEGWSQLVPAMVTLAGFSCPLEAPAVADAGQKQKVEFQRLIELAVRDWEPKFGTPVEIKLPEWCALARQGGLFHAVVGDIEAAREVLDGKPMLYKSVYDNEGCERALQEADRVKQSYMYMDKSQSTKLGNLLHKFYRGQVREVDGIPYKFADREARHSTFALERLKP